VQQLFGKTRAGFLVGGGTNPAEAATLQYRTDALYVNTALAAFDATKPVTVVIDEVQRAPELFMAIKAAVDRDRRPGRFLLTGSADVMLLPRLSESLAGRMEILTLWPLSQGEIEGTEESFIDALFSNELPTKIKIRQDWAGLLARMLRGGYPVIQGRLTEDRQKAWFGSYVSAILQRDVRDLASIEGLTLLPRLLSLLATRSTSLLNFSEFSRSAAIPQTTLKRYMALLEMTFLIQTLPAWSSNLGKRLVKAPKLILNDTGLMAYLLGLSGERLATESTLAGPLLENFVAMELRKQATWSKSHPQLFHFRTLAGQEVDIVLEDAAGKLVGIEVKASATVDGKDFRGLRAVAELTGRRFQNGVVLYTGFECIPFGPRLHAMPVSTLWALSAKRE
jgi:predicted AAA+ superfamily ATPase